MIKEDETATHTQNVKENSEHKRRNISSRASVTSSQLLCSISVRLSFSLLSFLCIQYTSICTLHLQL